MLFKEKFKSNSKIFLDGGNGYLDEEDCPLVNATGVGAKMTINETSQDQVVKIQIDNLFFPLN